MINVTQNADGSLTFDMSAVGASLGPITATATAITIAGQFQLPATVDPRVAIALADAKKVVADLS